MRKRKWNTYLLGKVEQKSKKREINKSVDPMRKLSPNVLHEKRREKGKKKE